MPIKVLRIFPGGVAAELGIEPGDEIVSINGSQVNDYLDYLFLSSDDVLEIFIRKRTGEEILYDVELYGENLGLEVEPIKPRRCRCKCIFCFMDQMPKGLRKSLYLKDDDYRLSFLSGNYITLVGMTEEDWNRIEKMKLSPLYVSVHTTNPELRAFLMGHPEAANIMDGLKRLKNIGVTVHAQIVVCPGINDGDELKRTIEELVQFYPSVRSVAVVPVGLTKFRNGLYPLVPVDEDKAKEILSLVLPMGDKYLKDLGSRFVFPADEFFIKANWPIPPSDFYENYFQLEDGVGMVRQFLDSVERLNRNLSRVAFVTGRAFSDFLEVSLKRAGCEGYEVVTVVNNFFGEQVTVAGLLTARDVVKSLKNSKKEVVVLAEVMFNDDGLTLDNYTVEDIGSAVSKKVFLAPEDPKQFWQLLREL
ncbi:conserved hypothetical protein [Thermosulfidibacter takaii ABI70S6]|uniref:PDZ domain-containing protein n=1 Tax=Thermosulfidibacter takaii (strain DSM 17441 / JCM 13301 / NBRC 103674 / ABI70S6) TaxID=1298851 RepID=A0A0S3QT74_THET7|nr:DUF512 domain-containing protein [Thermosulfidibacter takaii]BAT71525.1 conserved hypothetical protein [Thermosulfidibacter takaii ABI70S6]